MDNMMFVTKEMLEKLHHANDSVRGTSKYTKYHLCHEAKFRKDAKWSADTKWGNWKYIGWGVPAVSSADNLYIKVVKGNAYIMSAPYGDICDRWAITQEVRNLWGI